MVWPLKASEADETTSARHALASLRKPRLLVSLAKRSTVDLVHSILRVDLTERPVSKTSSREGCGLLQFSPTSRQAFRDPKRNRTVLWRENNHRDMTNKGSHEEEPEIPIDPVDLNICRFRGPGLHDTPHVRIIHISTGIDVTGSGEPTEKENKAKALRLLRERLRDSFGKS